MTDATSQAEGHFDGFAGGRLHGWAWFPDQPDKTVSIVITVNEAIHAELEASQLRPDLRAAGMGHGRYGFNIPFDVLIDARAPLRVTARAKDGPLLGNGEIDIGGPPPEADRQVPAFKAFLAAVLGQRGGEEDVRTAVTAAPRINFIVHSAAQAPTPGARGSSDDSYGPTLRAFAPLLSQLGTVHVVDDPAQEVDPIHLEHLARGETSLFLSFAPPHRTVLGLRCPTVPVIAWAFPTIPSVVWDEERRHDWRWVLRQTGRAITLSGLAADAIKASMGRDFPVVAIPVPVWDRRSTPAPSSALGQGVRLAFDTHVLDTRACSLGIDVEFPPLPSTPPLPSDLEVEGVVFTAVLFPGDGWDVRTDIVSAFTAALRGASDATLVVKIVDTDPARWWWEILDILSREPPFACRVLIVQGGLDDPAHADLIQASHWILNASKAEGVCLPLMEFLCAGRPAIAPDHTAMADYIDDRCALVVQSEEEPCSWPQDPGRELSSLHHRVAWSSLRTRIAEAYRITRHDPDRYQALSQGAAEAMLAFCSDEGMADRLDSFLGLARRENPGPRLGAPDLIAAHPAT